jgi:hypothetical protein
MKSFNRFLLLSLVLVAQSALSSEGGSTRGGGTGCLAEIMTAALSTSKLLDSVPVSRNLPINGESFLAQIDPNIFQFTQDDLQYEGNAVDAFFTGQKIQVRCDRFEANTTEGRERVLAHEIFRKMGIEGDKYEISRQIPGLSNILVSGVYQNLQDPTDRLTVDVETGLGVNNFVITLSPTWNPMVYSCSDSQCKTQWNYTETLELYHENLVLSLLDDGNFIFQRAGGTYDSYDGSYSGSLQPSPLKKYIYVGK